MLERQHKPVSLFSTLILVASGSLLAVPTHAQEGDKPVEIKKTFEPVLRVAKLTTKEDDNQPGNVATNGSEEKGPRLAENTELPKATPATAAAKPHPLDRAISFAYESLDDMRDNVSDYTATLCKVERVNGRLSEPCYIKLKIRCPREKDNGKKSPFSVYMSFLKPVDTTGREVIWVDGRNDGKLMAHEGKGLLAMKTFHLEPDSMIAMKGQRYPIYDIGIENLIEKLIEKAERDKQTGPCEVTYREGIKINKRECRLIELIHEHPHPTHDFHRARVFIDEELNLPCRYEAYDWPATKGGKPQLIEAYTYFNIKTNVGLTDKDFDPENPGYHFPN